MKRFLRILALLAVLSTALLLASCDTPAESAAGTYKGEFTLEGQMGGGDTPGVRFEHDIRAELVLDAEGTYTISTWHNSEFTNITYSENGSFTIEDGEITLVPDEAMFMVKGGDYEMRALTAEEQASMTSKGTLDNDTVTVTMRWLYPYHSIASEMQLVRPAE